MLDLATLGIAIKTDQVERGAKSLDDLTGAAGRAEQATERLAVDFGALNGAVAVASGDINRMTTATGQHTTKLTMNTAAVKANNAALVAQSAAAKMAGYQSRMLAFQLNDVFVSLASGMNPMMVAVQQGSQIAQIYGGQGGVAAAFRQTGAMITGVLTKFPLLTAAAAALGAGIGGLTYTLNQTGSEAFTFGEVFRAAMQVAAGGVMSVLNPAIETIMPVVMNVVNVTLGFFKDWGNNLIRLALGAFEMVTAGVMALPDAFIAAGGAAANGFIAALEWMAREALVIVNGLIAKINGMLPEGMKMGFAPAPTSVKFGRFDTSAAGERLGGRNAAMRTSLDEIAGTDYLGQFGAAVKGQALSNRLQEVESAGSKAGGALKRAADTAKGGWDNLRDTVDKTGDAINDSMDFAKSVVGGFMSDLKNGLRNGEGFWKSFATAATNALDKIADRLMSLALDQAFSPGGFLSGLFGGLFGGGTARFTPGLAFPAAPSFAGGGFTGYGARAGGMDGRGGFPAILHPNETVIDHTRAGRGQSGGALALTVTVNGARGNTEIEEMVQSGVAKGLAQMNAALPGRVQQIERQPRYR